MKKNILEDIETIKNKRKLSKEAEKKTMKKVLGNGIIAISIEILIMLLFIATKVLTKATAILIYNIYSIVLLIFTLLAFEIAYKKENDSLALSGIEILFLSVFTLFAPYIFYKSKNTVICNIMVISSAYYIGKILVIYCLEKKKYLLEISDITNIIKKESKDKLAKEFEQKRQEERQKEKRKLEKNQTKSKKTKKSKNRKNTKSKENK